MKQRPIIKDDSEFGLAFRKKLDSLERDLARHKEALERFQQSRLWRWTAPIRRVVNLFRAGGGAHTAEIAPRRATEDADAALGSRAKAYFFGLCQVSFEEFFTSGVSVKISPSSPEISMVFRELAAKEREVAQQKWLLERYLASPAWRWTAPIRWMAAPFLRSDPNPARLEIAEEERAAFDVDSQISGPTPEVKQHFTRLCRLSLQEFLAQGRILELPESENPTVTILLVLFNRAELTLASLKSIAAHSGVESEIVIVDNASTDETVQLLQRLKGARIIQNRSNRHFLVAANQAAAQSRGRYLLLLNNDAQLLPGALQSALQTLQSSKEIGAVGGRIILLDGRLQEAGNIVWRDGSCVGYGRGDGPFAPMYSFRRDVDYCSGAFLLTPRRTWQELQGFDEKFAPAYYEETDYCFRLRERGLRVVYEPDATVLHYEFGSSPSTSSAIDLQTRNRQVFLERHRRVLEKRPTAAAKHVISARSLNAAQRILVIDDRVPHVWLGSGFPRANALLKALHRRGYFITLYPIDVISEPWEQAYSDVPREVEIMMGMGRDSLELLLASRTDYYSAVIVSRPHNMQLLRAVQNAHRDWFKRVEVIYDAEALFIQREIGLRQLQGRPMSRHEIRTAIGEEIGLASAADRVIAVSQSERQTLLKHGIRHVEVLGHNIEPTPGDASFELREGLLFVGAVHDESSPNGDSLIWFLSEILPRIQKKLGDIPVTIAGVNQSDRIRKMARPPVRITGHLPSLDEVYLQARVFVAPTRYAGGIPHKVHEAAAHGLPVVTTPLLAAQLGWTPRELEVANDAESFADACIRIYTDSQRWTQMRHAALDRVTIECSTEAFERGVSRILSSRDEQLPCTQPESPGLRR